MVGAGGQGGPCASILAGDEEISEIRLGDINFGLAEKVTVKINSPKVTPLKLNAGALEEVLKASEGMDAIINLTLIDFNDTILSAAVAGNTHYVDTACDYSYLKQMVDGTPLKFNSEFREIGKTALMGCGATPGMSNVLIRYVCDQMDEVEKIYLRKPPSWTGRHGCTCTGHSEPPISGLPCPLSSAPKCAWPAKLMSA